MRIVWLASYPKSGNTFVRFLLCNYLFSDLTESIESMQVESRIPDIHNILGKGIFVDTSIQKNMIIKTHFLFREKHPYKKHSAGFIYIIRNPRDVLLSNSRYVGVTGKQKIDVKAFAKTFIINMGVPRWKKIGMGTWPEHVASWLMATNTMPHLFIKYEDLRVNTREILSEIIRFIGINVEEEKIADTVRKTSLSNMRSIEKKERQEKKASIFGNQGKNNYFVGEGKMNQSLAFLGDDIEELYQKRFGKFANIFGYN